MTDFVLDNSVVMCWHLESEKPAAQKYAESVLLSLSEADVLVPNLWHLEAANVMRSAEKREDTTIGEVERFIAQLENLPLHIDPITANQACGRAMTISRAYKIK